jgi:hypothetical protein
VGVYISKGVETKCREECRRRVIGRLHEVAAEAKATGLALKEVLDVVEKSFASDAGLYAPTPFPVAALAKAKKEAK